MGTLLVCIMADSQAEELVQQAGLLSRTRSIPWRVVYLDTMASRYASPRVRQALARALQEAEQAGAEVLRLSLEIDSASRVVSTIVQQAQSVRATHVLLGNLAMGRRYWFNAGERISDFTETLMTHLPQARVHILASPGRQEAPAHRAELASDTVAPLGRQAIALVMAVLVLCTALSALIAPYLHPINLSLIYMGGVFYIALRHGLKAALLGVLLAVLLFDWIFVAPRWSLKPTDPEYFFTFLITLGVGLAVSRLAAQSRQAALQAMVMAQHSQSLSLLSQSLARAVTPEDITHAVTGSINRDLGAQARLLLLDAEGRLPEGGADPAAVQRAQRVLRGETLEPASQGFALAAGGTPLGVLLVDGLPARYQGAGDLHLLQAYANQAAVAIERCRYAQRSEQAAIAAETERIRNTLLAGISHDFRTPLTAIIGAASAVLSQGHAITLAQRNALAQTVLDQATRLQSLTSDLLDMARLQDSRVRLTPEWCPVEDLVQDARAAVAGALDRHVLELEFDPDDVVWCDTTLMVQALANLLLNASQHSPAGSRIRLRIARTPGWWTLRVHDEGPGIAAGSEHEVFQKFYRGPQGGSQGTGLGLAICEVVARLHGGRIEAHNDHGAVFELTLPQPEGKPELEEALHG